ncbi:MAG: hypothetical protein J6A47_09165 [Bacilli bacterium]|nr:hypothetical protein [Bacilli bacterium]
MEFNIKASKADTVSKIANFALFPADYHKLSFKLPKDRLPKNPHLASSNMEVQPMLKSDLFGLAKVAKE